MYQKSWLKTLKSISTRNIFLITNGIQSKYFLFMHNHINNVPQLFEQHDMLCEIINNLFVINVILLH